MPIDFLCGQCQHTLRVPEESAGKRARCPQCGHVQAIPAAPSAPGGPGFDVGQFDQTPASGPTSAIPPGSTPSGYGGPYQPSNQQAPYQSYSEPSSQYRPNPYQSPAGSGYYAQQRKSLEQVRSRVKPPAIALMIVAGLSALFAAFMVFVGFMAVTESGRTDEEDVFMLILFIALFVSQIVIVIGAARMMVLKNYGFAMTVAILSLVSGLCCTLLMPFGIWAIVILADSDTRSHFS